MGTTNEAPVGSSAAFGMHVREEGSGTPVVLVHGLGGDHTVWSEEIPVLAHDHRVLAPDLRGHGRTTAPDGSTLSFAELSGDLLELLRTKQLERVHLVGLSAGGFLGLQIAVDAPERLRSLVVIGAAAHTDGHTRAIGENWARVYRTEGYDAYAFRLLKDLFYAEWLENHLDYVDEARRSMRQKDLRSALQWGNAMRSFDLRARLSRIRVPTLVVHGMDDRVVDPSHARLLRQAIPGAELKLLPYAGHLLPVEKPQEIGRILSEWLAKVDARPPATGAGGTALG